MYSIDHGNPSSEEIRSALREAPLTAIREKLKDRDILDACRTCGHTFIPTAALRPRGYGVPLPDPSTWPGSILCSNLPGVVDAAVGNLSGDGCGVF